MVTLAVVVRHMFQRRKAEARAIKMQYISRAGADGVFLARRNILNFCTRDISGSVCFIRHLVARLLSRVSAGIRLIQDQHSHLKTVSKFTSQIVLNPLHKNPSRYWELPGGLDFGRRSLNQNYD